RKCRPDQRRIATIGCTEDRNPARFRDALVGGPGNSVKQIVVHPATPLVVAGIDEGLAEAGRAAEVDGQNRVPAACTPLMRSSIPMAVTGPGRAMGGEYDGKGPCRTRPALVGRQC